MSGISLTSLYSVKEFFVSCKTDKKAGFVNFINKLLEDDHIYVVREYSYNNSGSSDVEYYICCDNYYEMEWASHVELYREKDLSKYDTIVKYVSNKIVEVCCFDSLTDQQRLTVANAIGDKFKELDFEGKLIIINEQPIKEGG